MVGEVDHSLRWLQRLDELQQPLVIDLVVLSHADEDQESG
jgi:hypothetical protein